MPPSSQQHRDSTAVNILEGGLASREDRPTQRIDGPRIFKQLGLQQWRQHRPGRLLSANTLVTAANLLSQYADFHLQHHCRPRRSRLWRDCTPDDCGQQLRLHYLVRHSHSLHCVALHADPCSLGLPYVRSLGPLRGHICSYGYDYHSSSLT